MSEPKNWKLARYKRLANEAIESQRRKRNAPVGHVPKLLSTTAAPPIGSERLDKVGIVTLIMSLLEQEYEQRKGRPHRKPMELEVLAWEIWQVLFLIGAQRDRWIFKSKASLASIAEHVAKAELGRLKLKWATLRRGDPHAARHRERRKAQLQGRLKALKAWEKRPLSERKGKQCAEEKWVGRVLTAAQKIGLVTGSADLGRYLTPAFPSVRIDDDGKFTGFDVSQKLISYVCALIHYEDDSPTMGSDLEDVSSPTMGSAFMANSPTMGSNSPTMGRELTHYGGQKKLALSNKSYSLSPNGNRRLRRLFRFRRAFRSGTPLEAQEVTEGLAAFGGAGAPLDLEGVNHEEENLDLPSEIQNSDPPRERELLTGSPLEIPDPAPLADLDPLTPPAAHVSHDPMIADWRDPFEPSSEELELGGALFFIEPFSILDVALLRDDLGVEEIEFMQDARGRLAWVSLEHAPELHRLAAFQRVAPELVGHREDVGGWSEAIASGWCSPATCSSELPPPDTHPGTYA